ncbi:enoyl-CoA hydratase-related protein [Pseudonocardia sp. MH-G8]|uniref:enoyl-CoA hydratase-related protein n=1 Tax=Pseudonocardia sp. MH-G8 TaxID=1854588 RepID=UPI001E44949F|nr:enoyl-CoA hydratase-related protein [Pseudonocardia sp. MH-G8]
MGSTADPARGGVHRSDEAGVVTLRLQRGERNALDSALADELAEALDACASDPGVRAVVLTGSGPVFSVGADLSAGPSAIHDLLIGEGAYERAGYREPAGRVTLRMAALGVPVIAAINGDAIGGGATIPLAADVRFFAAHARVGFPFTRLGVCPEGASTFFLPRLVGPSRAADWLLSGRLVDADEALAAGLVSRVVPPDEVLTVAQDYARELAARTSPTAVAATRRLLAAAPADPVTASDAESRAIAQLAAGPDCREGVAAFLERRPPRFADPVTDRGIGRRPPS